jgi:hypothetical protein
LTPIDCPACASEEITVTEQGSLECLHCGHKWEISGRICPRCGHNNSADVETCVKCGEALDVVDRLLIKHPSHGEPSFLREARNRAPDLKQKEEIASQQRLEILKEIDRRRLEALREAQRLQRQKERQTLTTTFWILAVMVLIIVVATLVIILRG